MNLKFAFYPACLGLLKYLKNILQMKNEIVNSGKKRDSDIYILFVCMSYNYLAQFLTEKYAESQSS